MAKLSAMRAGTVQPYVIRTITMHLHDTGQCHTHSELQMTMTKSFVIRA